MNIDVAKEQQLNAMGILGASLMNKQNAIRCTSRESIRSQLHYVRPYFFHCAVPFFIPITPVPFYFYFYL